MVKIIIGLLIGYFIGLISCLWQVFYLEKKHGKKIREILDEKNN